MCISHCISHVVFLKTDYLWIFHCFGGRGDERSECIRSVMPIRLFYIYLWNCWRDFHKTECCKGTWRFSKVCKAVKFYLNFLFVVTEWMNIECHFIPYTFHCVFICLQTYKGLWLRSFPLHTKQSRMRHGETVDGALWIFLCPVAKILFVDTAR